MKYDERNAQKRGIAKTFLHIAMLLAIILAIPLHAITAQAAELSGTIYTKDLELARFSLLTINTTPMQRIILENGTYSITLPPGTYLVQAMYDDGTHKYEDNATLQILDDLAYTYDFITFATMTQDLQELPTIDDSITKDLQVNTTSWTLYLIIALCAIIITILIITLKKKTGKTKKHDDTKEPSFEKRSVKGLSNDLKSILEFLEQEGGRTTQKELRRHVPCSEAKMSMMLTELEHKGRIERIKKGRANLIVLK